MDFPRIFHGGRRPTKHVGGCGGGGSPPTKKPLFWTPLDHCHMKDMFFIPTGLAIFYTHESSKFWAPRFSYLAGGLETICRETFAMKPGLKWSTAMSAHMRICMYERNVSIFSLHGFVHMYPYPLWFKPPRLASAARLYFNVSPHITDHREAVEFSYNRVITTLFVVR